MNSFFGLGPLEFFFIFLLAIIILGPKDMAKAGLTLGRLLRSITTSPIWQTIRKTSKDIREVPNRLMREAGVEDIKKDLPTADQLRDQLGYDDIKKQNQQIQSGLSDWTTPSGTIAPPATSSTAASSGQKFSPTPAPVAKSTTQDTTDWSTPRVRPPKPVPQEPTPEQSAGDQAAEQESTSQQATGQPAPAQAEPTAKSSEPIETPTK